MSRHAWRLLALGPVTIAAGCSLTSLDGFTTRSGTTSPDGSASDAASDTGGSIGDTPAIDAGVDGGTFCASLRPKPRFCSDFDLGAFPQPWDEVVLSGGGALAIETTESLSPPGSALSTLAPQGTESDSCLSRQFVGPFPSIRVELDMRVEEVGSAPYDVVTLYKSSTSEVGLQVTTAGVVEIDEDRPRPTGGQEETLTPTNFRAGKEWMHVRWTLAIDGAVASSTFEIDGATERYTGDAAPLQQAFKLRVGDCEASKSGGTWRVRFDNIVLATD